MKKKCNLKMMTAVGLIASLILLSVSSARADVSDIFGANIEPNVMILFDNSSSMRNSILSSSYNPSTTYTTGTYVATKVYKIKNQNSFSVKRHCG